MAATQVKFVQLSQNKYNQLAIGQKVATKIFFTTDTLRIYKGTDLYSQNVTVLTHQQVENYLLQNTTAEGCSAFIQHLYIDKQQGSMYICTAIDGKNQFVEIGISAELKARLAYLTKLEATDANKIVTVNANGSAFVYNKTITSVIADNANASNDSVVTEKAVRSIIGDGATAVTPLLSNGKLNTEFNPITVASIDNATGSDDFSKVKFIGDCKVSYGTDGQIIIRIGENLNSSTFNNDDGQTDGAATAAYSGTQTATLTGESDSKTVWLKGTNTVTVTTAGKIHFDNNTTNTFKLTVKGKDDKGDVTKEFTFGAITKDDEYSDEKLTGATLTVSGFAQETNTDDGATGYEGNVSFSIDVHSLGFTKDGYVSLEIQQFGTAQAKVYTADNMFWLIHDTATKASVSNVKAKWSAAPTTYTESGITTIKSGTVQYSATLTNISNPASQNESNSYVQLTNTKDFAPDLSNQAVGIDETAISKNASITQNKVTTTLYSGFYADTANCLSVSASNINGTDGTVTGSLYAADGTTLMSKLDIYTGSTDSSIKETNRRTDDGQAWDSTAALGANDLQVYHGCIQYPANTNFSGANNVNANRDYTALQSGEKYIILYYSAAGTQKGGTITLTGSNLNQTNIAGVVLGNSLDNLKDITSLSGIGTNPVFDGTTATFPYTFKAEADNITSATGCYVKISFKAGSTAKISMVTRG